MKRGTILLLFISLFLILSGCSSEKKQATGNIKVTKENKSYLEMYDKSLQGFLGEMTGILKTFNNSLDGLYTQTYSREQFATSVKSNIEKSNKLVTDVESVDVNPDLFQAHQNLILLVNRNHQLLLNAIEMTNSDRNIEKEYLRKEYMEIKTYQAQTANQWKILRQQLESPDQQGNRKR